MNHLVMGALEVLSQGRTMIEAVSAEQYQQETGEPFRASLGQHYRHVLEHFVRFLQGMQVGSIDYDKRERNLRLESDRAYALNVTELLAHSVATISEAQLRSHCTAVYSVSYSSPATPIASTIERELAYCVSHAVHHFAIMRLLCAQEDIEVCGAIGVAASTLQKQAVPTS